MTIGQAVLEMANIMLEMLNKDCDKDELRQRLNSIKEDCECRERIADYGVKMAQQQQIWRTL